jgi:hypothetical protein
MGSTASAPETTKTNLSANDASSPSVATLESSSSQMKKHKKKPPSNISGPKLVEYRCRRKKKAMSQCVSNFYENQFLTGQAMSPDSECEDLFEVYRTCYMRGMLKERERSKLPPPKTGTLLAGYLEEEGEASQP